MPNFEQDKQAAALWAYDLLVRDWWAILDTETTALYGPVCEIGIIDPQGNTLFESLINPEVPVSEGAYAKHGISDTMLSHAPKLPDVWPQVVDVLTGRPVLIAYNALYDKDRLIQSLTRYQLPMLSQQWQCAMKMYAEFFGAWNNRYNSYTWQPLGGNHRAIGDCLATLGKIHEMAAYHQEKKAYARL